LILVDTNVILRFLTEPRDDGERRFAALASELFLRAASEEQVFTTTDAVIAEVVFVLTKGRNYQHERSTVYALLTPVLELPGCAIPEKQDLLDALRLWLAHSSISIVDALCLASSRRHGHELMTFDAALERVARRRK
jgi:predicted nucleic acid-binding protein